MSLSSTRKRKRQDGRMYPGSPFVVQPHVSSLFDATIKVSPAVVLPRSKIPIQWLAGVPARLFEAQIEIPALSAPGNVVIVKVDGEKQLSAIEKAKDNCYVLYRLSNQLQMKDVRKTAAQTKHLSSMDENNARYIYGDSWWCGVGNSEFPFAECDYLSADLAALEMGTALPEISDAAISTPAVARLPLSPHAEHAIEASMPEIKAPSIAEILGQMNKQYFDTLYVTKTSLAYFSKSTLSRARAVCLECGNGQPNTLFVELAEHLQTMILPLNKMDLKYKESFLQCALDERVTDSTVFKSGEERFIQRWREATFEDRFIRRSDSDFKQKLQELRIREMELQIILLLEILALQKENPTILIPNQDISKGRNGNAKLRRRKPKAADKLPDPDVLLDLLVDRLCIWHSIGSETNEKGGIPVKGKEGTSEKDHLRHFSVEVIMAFYASKLPEKCASINKKFGVHVLSPSKPSSMIRSAKKEPRTNKPPSMNQSITTWTIPHSSRANTEPLSLLAAEGASGPKTVRGGTLNSKSFTKKIVQLDTNPTQKKADEELKNVIKTLKKPNRLAVSSEIVDDAEKRLANARNKYHKPKKPTKSSSTNVLVSATPKKRRKGFFGSNQPGSFGSSIEFLPHHSYNNTASTAPTTETTTAISLSSAVADTPFRSPHSTTAPCWTADSDLLVLSTPQKDIFSGPATKLPPRFARPCFTTNDPDAAVLATPERKPQCAPSPDCWSPFGGVNLLAQETPLKAQLCGPSRRHVAIDYDWQQGVPDDDEAEQVSDDEGDVALNGVSIYDALGWDDEE